MLRSTIQKSERYLCLLLCVLLVITGCACDQLTKDSAPEVPDEVVPEHSQLQYTDMVYERPNIDQVYTDFENAVNLAGQENVKDQLFELYDSLLEQISHISTMDTLATLQNEIDLSNTYYEEEMNLLDNELTRLDNRMNELTEAILVSPYEKDFRERMGEDFIERYEFYSKLNSPEIEELSEQENALVTEYKKLLSKEYSTTDANGNTVTVDTLDFNSPDVLNQYYAIYEQKNAECAEVYRQLVQVRVEIARRLGYDSYTDYAYDSLGRDFTKEDAARFSEMVKEHLVPVATALSERYYSKISQASDRNGVSVEDGLTYLEAALKKEFPAAMTEALTYMLDHGLYIFDDDPNMMPAAFTTIINDYAAPFLFINTATYTDPGTLFHEFGHYYNFYLMGETNWNDSNNLDLAEVHSQGLELLMFESYPDIYGDDAQIMQVAVISNLLDSILMGCCEDEFQQRVFENPEMSIEEMNQIHGELYQEYLGFPAYYEWVDIHHHFETPFYYISYATSAASAFEIWEMAQEDRASALTAYRSITQNTLNSGYLAPLERAGLNNPFTSDMVEQIASTVNDAYVQRSRKGGK